MKLNTGLTFPHKSISHGGENLTGNNKKKVKTTFPFSSPLVVKIEQLPLFSFV